MPAEVLLPIDVDAQSRGDLRSFAARELVGRARIAAARRGTRHSEETRRSISEGLRRSWARRKADQDAAADGLRGRFGAPEAPASTGSPANRKPRARETRKE